MNAECRELVRELDSLRDLPRGGDTLPALSARAVAHAATCAHCERHVAAEAEIIRGLRAVSPSPPLTEAEARRLRDGIRRRLAEDKSARLPIGTLPAGGWASRRLGLAGLAAALLVALLLALGRGGFMSGPPLVAEAGPSNASPLRVVWSDGTVDVVVREPRGGAGPSGAAAGGADVPVLASSRGAEWSF